jgi:hypothetical protein
MKFRPQLESPLHDCTCGISGDISDDQVYPRHGLYAVGEIVRVHIKWCRDQVVAQGKLVDRKVFKARVARWKADLIDARVLLV